MGEYDAKQRNQLCTLIANGNTGSKQLKGFVDNRCTTQKVASQIKVIQKASIDKWCEGVNNATNPTITLYSFILPDGLGDAGQLGYLVDKVRDLGYNPIPYANYDPGVQINTNPSPPPKKKQSSKGAKGQSSKAAKPLSPLPVGEHGPTKKKYKSKHPKTESPKKTEASKRLDILKSLTRIEKDDHIRSATAERKNIHNGWIDECQGNNTWEIQYPVPVVNIKKIDEKHLLRVAEMNQIYDKIAKYHTGIANASGDTDTDTGTGIGYGIPKYIPKSDDESNLRDKFIEYKIISVSEPDLPCLKDAWLVKVNEGQSVVDILKKAKEMGCTFLILLGKLDKQQQADYSNASIDKPSQVHKIESLEQSVLSCLMSKIGCDGGTGMIFAGGEGMYVQALGASEAAVGDVIRGGYSYQTQQIKADSKKKADDENSSDSAVMNFDIGENLGMMDIPQQELKAHSDWVRQSEHNWFNKLDGISFWDKAYTLYRWFISSPIPGYFEYFGEPINKDEFSYNYFTSFMEARTGNIAAKEAFRHIVSELVNIKCLYEKGAISDPHQDECD